MSAVLIEPDLPVPAFLVCQQGSHIADEFSRRIEYRFREKPANQVLTAWKAEEPARYDVYEVAASSSALAGGFTQQALNRPVVAALIRENCSSLVVSGFFGCTLDLPRIAAMLGVATVFIIPEEQELPHDLDSCSIAWIKDVFRHCRYIVANDLPPVLSALVEHDKVFSHGSLKDCMRQLDVVQSGGRQFGYSTYEFLSRDHPLLHSMQRHDTRYFNRGDRVLDVACGAGIFLDCLRATGVDAVGVERDPIIAEYGRGMGLEIVNQDAMAFLRESVDTFDGIYCSHFIEHLPIDVVQELMALLYQRLNPGGRLVLVFPDPESIRSQLLGFWRDPEHVRFYHPELVSSIATVAGLVLEGSSYDDQPHTIVGFDVSPPQMPKLIPPGLPEPAREPGGWLEKLCGLLGLQTKARTGYSEEVWRKWALQTRETLESQSAYLEQLRERTDKLWQVNATWAWNDNVTLLLQRPDA